MIKVKNLDSFDAAVQQWFAAVENAAAEAAVGIAHQVFEEVLETSPQYSGDFVANWKVSTNPNYSEFTPNAVGGYFKGKGDLNAMGPIFQMGSSPAMQYARSNAKWPKIKLGKSIYLHNNARHDEPYAWKIENGEIRLRPVNEGAEHVVRRALASVSFNYHNIGPVQLDVLRKFGV